MRRDTPAIADENPFEPSIESYLCNLFVSTSLRRLEARHIQSLAGLPYLDRWARESRCVSCATSDDLDIDHLRRHLLDRLREQSSPVAVKPPKAWARENLRFLAETLDLTRADQHVLQFLSAVFFNRALCPVVDVFGEVGGSQAAAIIAAAANQPKEDIVGALEAEGKLRATGLLVIDPNGHGDFTTQLELKVGLLDLLATPRLDRDRFLRTYLTPAKETRLGLSDFPDKAPVLAAKAMLERALRGRNAGINILLHGPTGVGKTELAALLAKEVGVPLFCIRNGDTATTSGAERSRLSSMLLAQSLSPRGRAILLFDELEDLFTWSSSLWEPQRASTRLSKQWLGSLLEENPVPTIWCTNRTDGIDPAYLRRFAYAIELRAPGAKGRAEILLKHVGDKGSMTREDADALAQRYMASPAQIAAAVRGARLLNEDGAVDRASVETVMAPVDKLVTGVEARHRPVFLPGAYRLDVLNCSQDLEAIAEKLCQFRPGAGPGPSICLYGRPGTGKSEYVRYLAYRTGRPLVYRRASDILSKWVGDDERNIAAAFAEAQRDGAILLFDEADSFLRERGDAVRSWEITMVNEFLQQLEAFPGIVACTTNLWRVIDEAALRRFVFKLELKFPTPAQVWELFNVYFRAALEGTDCAGLRRRLDTHANIAPGDFAAVSRRIAALNVNPSAGELVRMLGEEVTARRVPSKPIGFS